MRDAFSMCKDELVTKLLHLRSPRMAQAMKLIAKQKGVSTCTVGEITALYRQTVEVETQKCGSFAQPASFTQLATPAAVDFNEVVISFELTTEMYSYSGEHPTPSGMNAKVGRWVAALGPMLTEDGGFKMSIPPGVLQTIDLPTFSELDFNESVIPDNMSVWVKVFINAVYNNQLRTNIVYQGGPEDYRFDDVGNSIYERISYDSFKFEGLEHGWNHFTEVTLTCDREKHDATRKVQYEVRCCFNECPEDGGVVEPVSQSRAAAWICNLMVS